MVQAAFFAFAAIMVAGVAMWAPGLTEEAAQPEELAPAEVYSPTMGFNHSYMMSSGILNSYVNSMIWNSINSADDWKVGFSYEFGPPSRMSIETEVPANAVPPAEMPASRPARIQGQGNFGWSDLGWTFEPSWIEGHGTLFKASPTEKAGEPLAFQVWQNEPDAPLPVVSLPAASSPYTAGYEVPPVPSDASVMETPQYVDHTTRPELANRWQVKNTLEVNYPAALRNEGIGGTTVLYLFVNTDGTVSETIVKTSSGHPTLDWVAVLAAKSARFLPASNEGIPVGIWIEMEMPFVAD